MIYIITILCLMSALIGWLIGAKHYTALTIVLGIIATLVALVLLLWFFAFNGWSM